jgi:hypothetical protein
MGSNYFYFSFNIFRVVNEMDTIFNTCVGEEKRIHGFGGENEEKRPLGETRRRWEYNIKMGLH